RAGDLALAVRNFEESYTGRRELLGPDHGDTLSSRYNLALSLKKSGAVEKAIEVLLGDGEPVDASHGYLLSRCECLLSRFDDAVKHLKQSLSLEPEILRKALLENDLMPIIDRVQKG
ncbi:MAG: tetratricopeptide repeat protein, partial [Verrucomicrobia bacterium]|nr:tetratricopeptide repeat protein [Verrucomicrobiota bacterium]